MGWAGWKGEESVKERVVLEEPKVVPFLEGTYTLEDALADLDKKVPLPRPPFPATTHQPLFLHAYTGFPSLLCFACRSMRVFLHAVGGGGGGGGGGHTSALALMPGRVCVDGLPTCASSTACVLANERLAVAVQKRSETEKRTFAKFFSECQKAVDSKQLRPMTRTQYQRTAFQVCPTPRLKCFPKLASLNAVDEWHSALKRFVFTCASEHAFRHPHRCPHVSLGFNKCIRCDCRFRSTRRCASVWTPT